MDILKSLQQAHKILLTVNRIADAAGGVHKIVTSALPKLRIPRLKTASNEDSVKALYDQLVADLKAERAAHEQTRQYLRWATKEIDNVKASMRHWQKEALTKASSKRPLPRGKK
jgi:hypothetical protein